MEYHLRISGATLVLHENGSSADEISALLTARFGDTEAPATRAVALEDTNTGLVFPLDVVATRPDFVSQSENLRVIFSCCAETALLHQLRRQGMISDQELRTLIPLVEDPYVTAAFEVFREEGDVPDLVDTLHRIVAIRLNGGSSSSGKQTQSAAAGITQPNEDQVDYGQLSGNALIEQLTAALKLPEFPEEALRDICVQFRSQNKISAEDEVVLLQLINKHLPHLQAAYEVYLEEEDEDSLLKSLARIANHFGVERVVRGQPYAQAILEAFAANDPMVCGAWDVYVDEHNEEDFRDTLGRIYRRLVSSAASKNGTPSKTAKSATPDVLYSDKPSEEKAALRRFVLWLHTNNRISTEEGQKLMNLVDRGSPDAEKAMREYLASERTEVDGDKLLRTVKSLIDGAQDPATDDDDDGEDAVRPLEETYGENPDEDEELRKSIVLFLDDCVTKGLLSSENVIKLKTLVDVGDHRLLAAFDLFREERDLEDLIDTLQRLAEKVVVVGTEDENDADDEEDRAEEDAISEIIANFGLTLSQLELIRDAIDMRHPEVDHAIEVFSQTRDPELFKKDLLEFCNSAAKQGL